MKALLVTSEITFVPRNYLGLFERLFQRGAQHLGGLVMQRVRPQVVERGMAALLAAGCSRLAQILAANAADLRRQRREACFQAASLPVIRADSMNEPWLIDWVQRHAPDVIVNARTRCIFGAAILAAPRLGCVNVHHGILPRYRGTMCDLRALAAHRRAGFSIHRMTREVDAGAILQVEEVPPGRNRDYAEYLERSAHREGAAVARLLDAAAVSGGLPAGRPNRCQAPVVTRTPDVDELVRLSKELRL
jgi:methionyl-tRNA formyltransferase